MRNSTYKSIIQKCALLLLILVSSILTAQTRPPVLVLMGNNGQTTFFDTKNSIQSQLLNTGTAGQATIEFWVMAAPRKGVNSQDYSPWLFSNLKTGAKEFSIEGSRERIVVTQGTNSTPINLAEANRLDKNEWHHIALVLNTAASNIKVIVDGVQQGTVAYANANLNPQRMYMTIDGNDQLSVAEYRAWNRALETNQIRDNRFVSFYNLNQSNLAQFSSNGLVVAYANNEYQQTRNSLLPITETFWDNMLTGENIPSKSRIVSAINSNGNFALASLRNDTDHPIFGLEDVLLSATNGNGEQQRIASGNPGIALKWPHINGATSYTITRRNIRDASALPRQIATKAAGSTPVSQYVEYFDRNVLPNEIYQYTVTSNLGKGKAGVDNGFVFANGQISGNIMTPSNVVTQNALVETNIPGGHIPGSALQFRQNSTSISVAGVSLFQQARGNGTIEFWYRTPATGAGTNTVFKLGEAEIRISPANVTLTSLNPTNRTDIINYLSASKPNDTKWHHYAFAFSPTGGELYIDGGLAPLEGTVTIRPNASTTKAFATNLNRTSRFIFNHNRTTNYELDEIRIWNSRKSVIAINRFKDHVINANEQGLMAYYRLDLNDPNHIYNQAAMTLGNLEGISVATLNHLPASGQAVNKYGTYTNNEGRYRQMSINPGIQTTTSNTNRLSFTVRPSKPNSEFSPATRVVDIQRLLNAPEQTAHFTDISSLPISGKIVYRVPVAGSTTNFTNYPTVQNTGLRLNGNVVVSTKPNNLVNTNASGVYAIDAPPGRHRLEVAGVRPGNDNTIIGGADRVSLAFNGMNGYAETSANVSVAANQSFTWTGFARPAVTASRTQNTNPQTIMEWGPIKLVYQQEEYKLFVNNTRVITKGLTTSSRFTFFAIVVNPANNTIRLRINDDIQTASYTAAAINSKVYLGAIKGTSTMSDYFRGNLDILEYRTEAVSDQKLADIQMGRALTNDNSLKLSYSFEQNAGNRAVNLAITPGPNVNNNNFIQLRDGAMFDNSATSGYRRDFKYNYVALTSGQNAKLINPNNPSQYLFNITEPLSGMDFENTTRYSFVGNIAIPCDNNVSGWTGTMTRSDIQSPTYSVNITSSNFNSDNSIFTVNNLLPGQYRVQLTRPGLSNPLTTTVDLRAGNRSYDFSFRNPIMAEVTLRNITTEMVNNIVNGTGTDAEKRTSLNNLINNSSKIIAPTCGTGNSIYNLEANDNLMVTVDVFELYDGGQRCPVNNATVTLSGDMLAGNNNISNMTNSSGRTATTVILGQPNFIGDYLRDLTIAVGHEGRNVNLTRQAYVTGAQRSNSDFTLTDPVVGYVLYDPPGDQSSATLQRGSSYSFSRSISAGAGVNTNFTLGAGGEAQVSTVGLALSAPLGIGTAQGVSTVVASTRSTTTLGANVNVTYNNTTQNSLGVTLNQSISTSSSSDIVGHDADVFIGTSQVLTFGTGRSLTVKNCVATVDNNRTVGDPIENVPFVFTRQDIQDRVIRNLEELMIRLYDQHRPPTAKDKAARSSLNLRATIDGFTFNENMSNNEEYEKKLVNYEFQIRKWDTIIKRRTRAQQLAYIDAAKSFTSTTSSLRKVNSTIVNPGNAGPGNSPVTQLDTRISFSGGTTTSYALTRNTSDSNGNSGGTTIGGSTNFENAFTVSGVALNLTTNLSVSATLSGNDNRDNGNSRVDAFTFADDDIGDQFTVRIARDPMYDTAYFYTVAGQSQCPFESGTVPREGVEISADKTVGYGTGDESILYTLTLKNTQRANDATRKTYFVGINGASNSKGAQVLLNESPIFEPGTVSPIVFTLDPSSDTGVKKELTAQLRIKRGTDAPENISYENIGIRFYSQCELAGDGYRSYRVDEFKEVGVVPFQEIQVTANFRGACVNEITSQAPQANWVVNNTDEDKLRFRFRIPELVNNQVDNNFSVAIEYALPDNNTPTQLVRLTLQELRTLITNTNDNGFINYDANVSALANGKYRFRVTPICGTGDPNAPANRSNPTAYKLGTIAREAPQVVSTNPTNGGVLTSGQISVTFNRAINPASVVNSAISLRGILGGVPNDLVSAQFAQINDSIRIPNQSAFNLANDFTIEMWVNPTSLPSGGDAFILEKGSNYSVGITPNGRIKVNGSVEATKSLQPSAWTHVSVVYQKSTNVASIYYNGVFVGNGNLSKAPTVNTNAIVIAPVRSGRSFIGRLDEIRIWSSERNLVQIVANSDKQLVGSEPGLVAYFVLDNIGLKGTNGAPDEAIRDFTGNAIGTRSNGVEFVRGENLAAPLDITAIAKNLDFTTVTASGNTVVQINPVFTKVQVEGAQLTAMVNNNQLEDPFGNKIAGTSWAFTVNRNTIQWSKSNLSVNQVQGASTRITSVDLDNSKGGIPVRYRFVRLPSWLSVEKRAGNSTTIINQNSDQTIQAGQVERDLEFVVAPYLNPGNHAAKVYIETFNANTGSPLGVEVFDLDVNVFCSAPNYRAGFNQNSFIGSKSFTGRLNIGGVQSNDTRDIVAAYYNGQFRGSANVNSNGLVNLAVYGSVGETGALTFRVWDASECTEYEGIVENYSFALNGVEGTNGQPISFTVGNTLVRRIPLVTGFQDVSFNVRNTTANYNLPFTAIKGLVAGDRIIDAVRLTNIAIVNASGNLVQAPGSSATAIDTKKSYTVYSTGNKIMEVQGIEIPLNTNITIAGRNVSNAVPYYPDNLQRVSYALRSLNSTTVHNGDRISYRGTFAEYSSVNGWTGNLTHLTPGLGYIIRSNNNGILNYSGIAARARGAVETSSEEVVTDAEIYAANEYLRKAAEMGWETNPNEQPSFMYIHGEFTSDEMDTDKPYIIAAFHNNEVRGVAKPELIDGKYHYFLGVGGSPNEDIQFKIFDGFETKTLANVEGFKVSEYLGNAENTYKFVTRSEENALTGYTLSQNSPNPFNDYTRIQYSVPADMEVTISIYNVLGQKLGNLMSKKVEGNVVHTLDWNGVVNNRRLPDGTYIYEMVAKDRRIHKKLIINTKY